MRNYAQLALVDPTCTVDWRWRRVRALCGTETPARASRLDDEWVKKARRFLLRYRQAGSSADRLYFEEPDLFLAYRIFESRASDSTSTMATILEARLLTEDTYASIAKHAKTTPGAIRCYSKLFYDVRPHLDSKDWILAKAILPSIDADYDRREPYHGQAKVLARSWIDSSLRLFGYLGGSHLLDHVLFHFPTDLRARSSADVADVLDVYLKTVIRSKAVLAMSALPINTYNAVEVANLHVSLMVLQKDDDGKTKERFLTEAVDAIMNSAAWEVSTRRALRDDEPVRGYLLRHGETPTALIAPAPDGVDIRERVAEARQLQQSRVAVQSGGNRG
jgi:hypothetical protein